MMMFVHFAKASSLLLLLPLTIVLAGCGATAPDAGSSPPSSTGSPAVSTPSTSSTAGGTGAPVEVPERLRFTSTTLDGAAFSGETLAGKAAVLWFWAPWCPKCQREAPGVAASAKANEGKVTFLGVAAQDKVPAMQGFVDKYELGSFQHLADVDAAIWRHFEVTQQPAYAFVRPDGSVDVVKGQLSEAELGDKVAGLITP